jgi:hypothetical protein
MLDRMRLGAEPTVGAEKAYQWEDFVSGLRKRHIAPHLAEPVERKSWPNFLTEQERQHPGFAISQAKRKLVEKVFGWLERRCWFAAKQIPWLASRAMDVSVSHGGLQPAPSGVAVARTVVARQ